MGIVFRGRDRELARDVAIKVTTWSTEADADRLRREARILADLEHPGIVPVHDVGQLPDGRVYSVMMLVRGERLDTCAAALAAQRSAPAVRSHLRHRLVRPRARRHPPRSEARQHHDRPLRPGPRPRLGHRAPEPAVDRRPTRRRTAAGTEGYMAPEQDAALRRALGRVRAGRDPGRAGRAIPDRDYCDRSDRSSSSAPGSLIPARGIRTCASLAADVRRFVDGAAVDGPPRVTCWSATRRAGARLSDADRAGPGLSRDARRCCCSGALKGPPPNV